MICFNCLKNLEDISVVKLYFHHNIGTEINKLIIPYFRCYCHECLKHKVFNENFYNNLTTHNITLCPHYSYLNLEEFIHICICRQDTKNEPTYGSFYCKHCFNRYSDIEFIFSTLFK